MIALARVDARLLHGQVLETWAPRLRASRIVVADDEAAESPLARDAMTLALPPELAAEVTAVGETRWEALAASSDRVLLLFRDLASLGRAVAAGLTPALAPRVNLGNVHHAPGRRRVTPSLFLSGDEVAQLEELARRGFEVEARAVPTDAPMGAGELARKFGDAAPAR